MRTLSAKGIYFPHYSDMRSNRKVKVLRFKFGSGVGYSFCCLLMELIAKSKHREWEYSHIDELILETGLDACMIGSLIKNAKYMQMFQNRNDGIYYIDESEKGISRNIRLCRFTSFRKRLSETSPTSWKEIKNKAFKRDNFTCVYCGKVGGLLEGDHAIPVSRGGDDNLNNIVTACRTCNRQKRNKQVEEFLAWKGRSNG
jgi:hypothetical protein